MVTTRRRSSHYDKLLASVKFRVGTIEVIEVFEAPAKSVHITVNFGDYKRKFTQTMPRKQHNLSNMVGRRASFAVQLGPDNTVSAVLAGGTLIE